MAALSLSALRSRIAAAIVETLGADGWRQSSMVYDLFPGQDSRQVAHLAFAVGVPGTVPTAGDRQNSRGGATTKATLATTVVSVRWTHRLRADGPQISDYDDALDAEQILLNTIMSTDTNPDLAIKLGRIPIRTAAGDGTTFLGQLDFEVLHRLALE